MARKTHLLAFLLVVLVHVALAEIRRVPQQYGTIQAAIHAAVNGDTVLVEPGTYYENIRFSGKGILIASRFILDGDETFIRNTIINGGSPQHPDTASCVLFIDGEDSTAVLAGFTLTGGRGIRWLDEHGAGTYWEGGGVLSALSSPTIRNNYIVDNEAINNARAASAGGGGIRSGDGAPRILNNVILSNRAMYGGGIVLNYCAGAVVRNNIIAENSVYQAANSPTYGGGGIWINNIPSGPRVANLIENNTLIGNSASGNPSTQVSARGGALIVWNNANVVARNNILWANMQTLGGPVFATGATFALTYSAVEGGYSGNGNINLYPAFADSGYYLTVNSPCVDAGDPGSTFDDPNVAGTAEWPSLGTARNDIGAYGGPGRSVAPPRFSRASLALAATTYDFGNILPGNAAQMKIPVVNLGASTLVIDRTQISVNTDNALTIVSVSPHSLKPAASDTIILRWAPVQNGLLQDTLLIFSNDTATASPVKIVLLGNANPTPRVNMNTTLLNLGDIDVNTLRVDTTLYLYNSGTGADSVYITLDYRGITPSATLAISSTAASIGAGDTLAIRFSIFPPAFLPPFASLYVPRVIIQTRFTPGAPRFEKNIRFRLVGAVHVEDGHNQNSPTSFALAQNYPNPFNPKTQIRFTLAQPAWVSLRVFDVLGNEVAVLKDGRMPAGIHEVSFEANALSGGVYFYTLRAGSFAATRRMILLK
jgi:hypothetical protein